MISFDQMHHSQVSKYDATSQLDDRQTLFTLFDKVFNTKGIWVSSDMQLGNSYGVIHQGFPSM
jgi:hypothetical protein